MPPPELPPPPPAEDGPPQSAKPGWRTVHKRPERKRKQITAATPAPQSAPQLASPPVKPETPSWAQWRRALSCCPLLMIVSSRDVVGACSRSPGLTCASPGDAEYAPSPRGRAPPHGTVRYVIGATEDVALISRECSYSTGPPSPPLK